MIEKPKRLRNVFVALGDTNLTSVYTCPSNFVGVIKEVMVCNVDGSASADITINFNRSSTNYPIVYTVTVDNDATLDLLNKSIYLEEGDSLNATASVDGDLTIVCSYEIIE